MKYLKLYKEWAAKGEIPLVSGKGYNGGLCAIFGKDKQFKLLKPLTEDELETRPIWGYWGCDGYSLGVFELSVEFTPLRQNIVLLMAALNGEL